jgi:fumarate reductase flavoprotein subunit
LTAIASPSRAATREVFDFLIVGAGTAGIPAAIAAARRGARVLLIDAADKVGGTLHLANGQIAAGGTRLQAMKGILDSPERHLADILHLSNRHADAALMRQVAEHAPATIDGLMADGLVPLADHPVTGDSPGRPAYTVPRYLWGANAGRDILAALMPALTAAIDSGRVRVQTGTRAVALLQEKDGGVTGISAEQAGRSLEFFGRHVVLATGGYAMNPRLFAELVDRPAYGGGSWPENQGEGLVMARACGAGLRGQSLHRAGTGSILTADQFPARVYARFSTTPQERQPWEIWVDAQGRRFIAEDEQLTNRRANAVAQLRDLRYAIVFDAAIFERAPVGIPGWSKEKLHEHFGTHRMFHRADTIEGLAQAASIDAGGLAATIDAYNQAVEKGHDTLGRRHLPLPIAKPPYYAVIHLGHSATSSTGLTVDAQLRVLREDGRVIPNLYAAGEVLGSGATLGDAFVPGMMLTPALVLGRLLGENLPVGRG